MAGMRAARPGALEYEVEAAIEAVHRARGAVSWSYPSIVGSGPNATILHYPESNRQMQAGDLLLVDAAATTSTCPATSPAPIRSAARSRRRRRTSTPSCSQAQEEAMKVARAGTSLRDVHDKTVEVIKAGLLKLGLITDASGDQYRMWYTHGASHYIGIDVHDVGERTRPAAAGHGVRDRTGHLHPPERARRAAEDAREPRAHREDPAGGDEVRRHRRPHRRLVPARGGRAAAPLRRRCRAPSTRSRRSCAGRTAAPERARRHR